MARRRWTPDDGPAPPAPLVDVEVPECLRAGLCVEVWADDGANPLSAYRRHHAALHRWRVLHGLGRHDYARYPPELRAGGPWSYRALARQPALLADQLHRLGLPPDWTPTPAPAAWLTTATTSPNPRGTS